MRLLVLAHEKFAPTSAKTAYALLKYSHERWSQDVVVGVVDRTKAGQDAGDIVGDIGRGIPVVASTQEGLRLRPDALAIGIAPVGGALPPDWREDVAAALRAGITVMSGLHTSLAKDPEFAALAREHRATLRDVRHEHPPPRITTGAGLGVDALVVLHVGTDCSSGKMTAAVELTKEARRRGLKAAFVATGQTGIMIGCDAGAPIDALVSDFVAGAVEECVLKAAQAQPDIIFVEGQGALTHPAYSGVTASLLHGAFPDVLVLSDEPRRERLGMPPGTVPFLKNSVARERDLNEAHLAPTSRGRVGAVALMTRGLTDDEYLAEVENAQAEAGVPAGDVFRGDAARILDGVLATARAQGLWDEKGLKRGVKPRRVKEGLV